MRDLHNNLGIVVALNSAAIAANVTVAGAIIDTKGFDSLEFVIQSGILADGAFTPALTEGDAADLSDGSLVVAGDLLGGVAGATFVAADDNKVKKIGYRGNKRFVRLSLVTTGVTTGGIIGATAILGHPARLPVA